MAQCAARCNLKSQTDPRRPVQVHTDFVPEFKQVFGNPVAGGIRFRKYRRSRFVSGKTIASPRLRLLVQDCIVWFNPWNQDMPKILVVDDSPLDRRLVGGLLTKINGVEVSFAVDGAEALASVQQDPPDLVLTDLEMPVLDGLELVRRLRDLQSTVPVILMTAAGNEQVAVRALQAGAASYVSKRTLPNELWDTVANVLRVSGERRAQSRVLNRLQRWESEFLIENDLELVTALSAYLMQNFSGLQICSSAEQLRVGVALDEALLNAYFHGNMEVSSSLRESNYHEFFDLAKRRSQESPYRERRISVRATFSSTAATFMIRDDGPGFDVSTLPDPRDPRFLDRPHGRGLLLMRTFLDEVRYNERGNEVTLVKHSKRTSATDTAPTDTARVAPAN
jgi:CheY-like chemotaxis protein/anti-sigma regulatory factor (Ser/Thr protein kinase)